MSVVCSQRTFPDHRSALCQERTLLTSECVNQPGTGKSAGDGIELTKKVARQRGFLTLRPLIYSFFSLFLVTK